MIDCASPSVIAQTFESEQQWVRLYFRPRTPTQYANKGIRPSHAIHMGAHCPAPVYLVFDASEILPRTGTLMTDGSVAKYHRKGEDADFLRSLDFRLIYHDSWFQPEERNAIVNARHAEVLVPEPLDFSSLKNVVCRSPGERDTLLSLLESDALERYRPLVALERRTNLFFKRFNFVDKVSLSPDHTTFEFAPDATGSNRGPFNLRLRLEDLTTGHQRSLDKTDFMLPSRPFRVGIRERTPAYRVRLMLDDALAYQGTYREEEDTDLF